MVEGELQNIGPDLAKKDTRLRERILVSKRMAVALWSRKRDQISQMRVTQS